MNRGQRHTAESEPAGVNRTSISDRVGSSKACRAAAMSDGLTVADSKIVSHTPIECEKLLAAQRAGSWIDVARTFVREPEKLFTWWSYRSPDWIAADKGRRLDHVWVSQALGDRLTGIDVAKDARGWSRPSDHVPVTATLEV